MYLFGMTQNITVAQSPSETVFDAHIAVWVETTAALCSE